MYGDFLGLVDQGLVLEFRALCFRAHMLPFASLFKVMAIEHIREISGLPNNYTTIK